MPRSDKSDDRNESTTLQCYYGEGMGIISIPSDQYGIETITVAEYGIGKLIGQKLSGEIQLFTEHPRQDQMESFLSLIML
jgi:hypothetical protein